MLLYSMPYIVLSCECVWWAQLNTSGLKMDNDSLYNAAVNLFCIFQQLWVHCLRNLFDYIIIVVLCFPKKT